MTIVNKINGYNLRIARLINQLSLHALAQQLNISVTTLAKMETGITQPNSLLIKQLCYRLGILPLFLTNSSRYNIHEDAIFWVPTTAFNNTASTQAAAYFMLYCNIIRTLKTQARLPNKNFPKLYDTDTLSKNNVEQVADACRFHWGLGFAPIKNTISLVEESGAIVTSFPGLYSSIDSMSITFPYPIIVINQQKTAYQIRFDIAMQFGAIISNFFFTDRSFSSSRRILEHFALALLMPACSFCNEFSRSKSGICWSEVSSLQQRWGVSKEAVIYRAFQLKLINAKQLRYGLAKLRTNASIYSTNYLIDKEQPQLIASQIQLLEKNQQLPISLITQHLSITKLLLTNIFTEFGQRLSSPSTANQIHKHNVVSINYLDSNNDLPSHL